MSRALVLNATFEPLSVVSSRRALLLVIADKAEMLHQGTGAFRSERVSLPAPSVVRLLYFVKVPFDARVALNRRAVFARDHHSCQYCGAAAENIDHVIPRSRGGQHTWDNVVASCRACNARKEDRLLTETTLALRHPPLAPRHRTFALASAGAVDPEWESYLAPIPSLSA